MIHFRLRYTDSIIAVSIILFACNSHSQKEKVFEKEYYPNGKQKSIAIPRSDGAIQVFSFDTIGNCTDLLTSKNEQMEGEQLWFYPNGFLKQKTGYKQGKPDGFSYQYYPSGAVENQRFLKNGYEQEFGLDYYDSHIGIAKATLYFNDSGKIYFKQNFDNSGKLINEEGKKPKELQ